MKSQYPSAADAVGRWILTNKMEAGARLPSAEALAKLLGFKSSIMQRACQILVSKSVLHREGNRLTVGSAEQETFSVAGVVYVVSYFDGFSRVVCQKLAERKINYRLVQLSYVKDRHLHLILGKLLAEKPAGLILCDTHLDEMTVALLNETHLPMTICTDGRNRLRKSMGQSDYIRGVERGLRYLHDNGHRRVAYVAARHDWFDGELDFSYRAACSNLGLKSSPSNIWRVRELTEACLRETIENGKRRHPEVTALFSRADIGNQVARIFSVPEDFSLLTILGDRARSPVLTTVAHRDSNSMALWALTDLVEQIEIAASGLPARSPVHTFFVPDLLLGESIRPLNKPSANSVPIKSAPTKAKADPWSTWQHVYPFLKNQGKQDWLPLDLTRQANHSMTRQHGWLGADPLAYFPPGLRTIHGVPFQVLDENRNGGHAVVTFRSPRSHSVQKKPLPTQLRIKVGSRVKAIYFLHGCGYVKPVRMARYTMHFESGTSSSVALIPLGTRRHSRKGLAPNIQDWWSGFEQKDFPHAHRVTISDPSHPGAYECTLYSLEWINPRPGEKVTSIEVRVDPSVGPTLALIAVTASLPKRNLR